MRIVLDTGDLRELANAAASASTQVHAARTDVSNARNAVVLNTREDATLRRHDPDEDAHRILRELDRLEDEYRQISRSYERQADAVEEAARSTWRPTPFPIHFEMPSWGRLAPPSPFGVIPGGISGIVSRMVPPFMGAARSTVSSIGRSAASTVQRGFGFIRSGWDAARRGFTNLVGRLRETVAEAWARVWSRTQEILRSVIDGLRDIVAFSGNVITRAWDAASAVGRWIGGAVRNSWNYLGRIWDSLVAEIEMVFTLVDAATVLGIFRSVSKIFERFKLSTAFGALFTVVDFFRYGLGDARFWESMFKFIAAVAISVVTAIMGISAALPSLVLFASALFGKQLYEWFLKPIHVRDGQIDLERIERETQEFIDNLERKQNPHAGNGINTESGSVNPPYIEALKEGETAVKSRFESANTYPSGTPHDEFMMSYNPKGNCTSFVAWRLNDLAHQAGIDGYRFDNNTLRYGDGRDINLVQMGNAGKWVQSAAAAGIPVSEDPMAGSVLIWEPNDGKGKWGHVAIVKEVLPNGDIIVQDSSWGSAEDGSKGEVFRQYTLTSGQYPRKFLKLLP